MALVMVLAGGLLDWLAGSGFYQENVGAGAEGDDG